MAAFMSSSALNDGNAEKYKASFEPLIAVIARM
jgi:hypothetical protein